MRTSMWIAAILGLALAAGPAFADDKADCLKGIEKLKAVKKPSAKQKSQLAELEQEQMEADWSHCKEIMNKK
jgi:hypothetical protein